MLITTLNLSKISLRQLEDLFGIIKSMTILCFTSYSQGFKGGGFNPPFNATKFPNTEFVYPSTEVKAVEFGVKASVPEAGLTANASFYYNDFKNYTISVIRNETGINEGLPLEQYGAELELFLASYCSWAYFQCDG